MSFCKGGSWTQRNFYSAGAPFRGRYLAMKEKLNAYFEGADRFSSVFQTLTLSVDLS